MIWYMNIFALPFYKLIVIIIYGAHSVSWLMFWEAASDFSMYPLMAFCYDVLFVLQTYINKDIKVTH